MAPRLETSAVSNAVEEAWKKEVAEMKNEPPSHRLPTAAPRPESRLLDLT
jgi:hypothetical protein